MTPSVERRRDDVRPTSASSASVGPAPSSSPSCQATTAGSVRADRERERPCATPRRRRRSQAARAGRAARRRRAPSTKTASSATTAPPTAGPIATGPSSVIRKSARGAEPPPEQPGGHARRSARTSTQHRRAAQVGPASPASRRQRARAGTGRAVGGRRLRTAHGLQSTRVAPTGPPDARERPRHRSATLVGPSSALMSPISAVLGPDPQPLVEPQHRLAAAVDQLELHLGGARVAAQHLARAARRPAACSGPRASTPAPGRAGPR